MTIHQTSLLLRGLSAFGASAVLASCASVGMPPAPALALDAGIAAGAESARYEVSFIPSWNPATNPLEYPLPHAKKGLLTPPIGATHDATFAIFAPGTKPTAGLERLSEMGKHSPLDMEIKAAIGKGTARGLIRFRDGSAGPVHPAIAMQFDVTKDAPLVSLVGMIAPSPDWFYGVSSLSLCKQGSWVPSLTVPVYAWDSGGDAGSTYLAEDLDLNPKQPTRQARTAHFVRDGEPCPVGYFVFKQVPVEN